MFTLFGPDRAKFGRRGTGLGNHRRPLPAAPTQAEPGSPAKIAIMQERARRGEALFHPLDAGPRWRRLPRSWEEAS